jgi:peptidoglycan biosynthesis protein MviN/MurJ (putative lipid II flippase)
VVRWTAVSLAANVLFNLALVPLFNIRGAATAFLLTESGLCLVFWLALPHPAKSEPGTASGSSGRSGSSSSAGDPAV